MRQSIGYVCLTGLMFAGALTAADSVCGTGTLLDVGSATRFRQGQEATTSSVRVRDHGRERTYQSVTSPSEQKVTEYSITARLDGIVYTAESRDFFWRTKPTSFIVGDPIRVCVSNGKISLTGSDGKTYKASVVRAAREEITPSRLEPTNGAPVAASESSEEEQPANFSPGELDRIVSRIALYPDPLLAQILAAATYPDQIPEAAAWSDLHNYEIGDAFAHCIREDRLSWDSSVQALLPFPSVLLMMNREVNWTRQLGDATLVQRDEVMDAVQRMRQRARDFGYLQSNEQIRVTATAPNIIEIEPTNPVIVSVPVYDPGVVFARRPFDGSVSIWVGPTVAIGPAFTVWGWEDSGFAWSSHRFRIGHGDWHDDWKHRYHEHEHDRRTNFRPLKGPERVPQRREIHVPRPAGGSGGDRYRSGKIKRQPGARVPETWK